MSAGFNVQPLSCQYSDIPNTLESSKRMKPIPLNVTTAYLSTQSGTQSQGGSLIFQLNSANGYIKPGSMYLKARISVLGIGANPAANSCVAWGNGVRNASSIIDRWTVNCSSMLESINYYGSSYVPTLLLHASNESYVRSDDAILEGTKRPAAQIFVNAANVENVNQLLDVEAAHPFGPVAMDGTFAQVIDVCIPIYSNLFNNEIGYPLCLLQQNTIIQLDLSTVGKAFYTSAAGIIGDYKVSNAFLVYDLIQPSAEFIMMEKQKMAQGQLFQMPFVSALSSTYQKAGMSNTVNWGCGLSSLLALTYTCQVAPGVVNDPKYFQSDSTLTLATGGALPNGNFRLFLDSVQKNSVIQDTIGCAYSEMQKCFGILGDVSRTSANGGVFCAPGVAPGAVPTTYTTSANTYNNNYFVGGQNCTKVNENMALTGSAVNNVQFILDTTANACTVILALAWHQRILTIAADGSASILL